MPWPTNKTEFGPNRTPILTGLSYIDESSIVPIAVDPTTGYLLTSTTITPSGTQDVNMTEVGGSNISLGQATMSDSLPVTIASNQSALSVSQSGTWNVGLNAGNNTIGAISNTSFTATQSTGSNLHVVVDSGSITPSSPPLPSSIVAFVTTITTAGTRVQLSSNSLGQGVVIEAPSTNTGSIYVGGSTVSSSVYGAELQPGQSTGLAIDNTNLIYADTATNGNKIAVIGS